MALDFEMRSSTRKLDDMGLVDSARQARFLHMAALVAAFAGLFCAAVLSVAHVLDLPIPCGVSRGCTAIASHPSSRLAGVPIAFFGVAAYLVQITLLGRQVMGRRTLLGVVVLAAIGSLVSAGLLLYSHVVIGATCSWCVASGVAMTTLFVFTGMLSRQNAANRGTHPAVTFGLGIVTAVAIGIEAGRMERAALAPPIAAERLAQVTAGESLDSAKSLGPDDALITITLFADFLCPACRAALDSLIRYQVANPRDVRLVYRHLPLGEIRGHETSKAAAALSEMAGEAGKFWAFAQAIHAHAGQMTRTEYLDLMSRLGLEPVSVEVRLNDSSDRAITNVQRDIALAERLGIQTTPTYIVQVGTYAPVSASQRGLGRILNSTTVVALLAQRAQLRHARN